MKTHRNIYSPKYKKIFVIFSDENECEKSGSCHPAAICENLVGGYSCSCPSHMTGDGLYYCGESSVHVIIGRWIPVL